MSELAGWLTDLLADWLIYWIGYVYWLENIIQYFFIVIFAITHLDA